MSWLTKQKRHSEARLATTRRSPKAFAHLNGPGTASHDAHGGLRAYKGSANVKLNLPGDPALGSQDRALSAPNLFEVTAMADFASRQATGR